MRLLLADDDSFLLDMYAVKFIEAGHEVTAVRDGTEALAALRKGAVFDGVLLDMVMPGLSGLELIAVIKKEGLGGKDCKCLVLSNQGEQEDISAATKAGAAGYIVKAQAMPSEVVEKVTKMLTAA